MTLENQSQILDKLIEEVRNTQMTRVEYKFISDLILSIKNCNVLIFGTGRDSQLWVESSKEGKIVFLEPDEKWIKIAKEKSPNIDIRHIKYNTVPTQALSMFFNYKRTGEMKNIPPLHEDIVNTEWDVILIDSPVGGVNGRMSSIFISNVLSQYTKKDTHIFLHDCEREVEMLWGHLFLLPNSKKIEEHNWDTNNFTKLNYYIK